MLSALQRIGILARETLADALRRRTGQALLWVAAAIVAGTLYFGEIDFGGDRLRFAAEFGSGGLYLFGSLAALLLPIMLFHGAVENRSLLMILARPVSRGEFLVGAFIGHGLALALIVGMLGAANGLLLFTLTPAAPVPFPGMESAPPPGIAWSGWLAHLLLQWLRLWLLAAVALLAAVFFRAAGPAFVVASLVFLIGELRETAVAVYERSESAAAGAGALLLRVFPDLTLFHTSGWAHNDPPFECLRFFRTVLYGLFHAAAVILLAVWFFRKREV